MSGIARQALSVIHEAAQATGSTESHGSSEAGSSRRGVEATRGGSPFTHPNGNSQGIVRQDVKVKMLLEGVVVIICWVALLCVRHFVCSSLQPTKISR